MFPNNFDIRFNLALANMVVPRGSQDISTLLISVLFILIIITM